MWMKIVGMGDYWGKMLGLRGIPKCRIQEEESVQYAEGL